MIDPIALLDSIIADASVQAGWGLDASHLDKIRTAVEMLKTGQTALSERLAEVELAAATLLVKTDRVYAVATNHQDDIRKLALKEAMEAMNQLRRVMAPPAPAEMPLSNADRAALAELAKGLDQIAIEAERSPLVKP